MENENMNNTAGTPENNETVADKINDAVAEAGDAVESVADKITDAVADAVNTVDEKVDEVADSVVDAVTDTSDNTDNAIRPDAIYNNPYAVPEQQGSPALAIVSMILGILSILLGCCCSGGNIIFGIPAIITGVISKKKNLPGGGMALAGIITGVIGTVFALIMFIFFIIGMIGSAASY